jgi:hypothetical protein
VPTIGNGSLIFIKNLHFNLYFNKDEELYMFHRFFNLFQKKMILSTAGLGKKERSGVELGAELATWGLTGVLVHSFAQGIQQKPIFRSKF